MAGGSTTVVTAALIGNSLIAVTKFIAAAVTGSSAMFAEAIHSVVDTGNQGLLFLGIKRAARPPDAAHPFGHGKEIYFWAFVVAILLFALGSGVSFYEGFHKLSNPHPIENARWNYIVLGLAAVFEGGSWFVAWRELQRTRETGETALHALHHSKDPSMFTVLFEDTAALLGLLTAAVGVFCSDRLGLLWTDGGATLVIGGILAVAAVLLARETKSLLIGESADEDLIADIIGMAGHESFVDGVNEVRTVHFGPDDVLVNLSVDAKDDLRAGDVETGISRLETAIRERFPEVSRVFIEIQKARDSAARIGPGDEGAVGPA